MSDLFSFKPERRAATFEFSLTDIFAGFNHSASLLSACPNHRQAMIVIRPNKPAVDESAGRGWD
jgi:hypothetical protein